VAEAGARRLRQSSVVAWGMRGDCLLVGRLHVNGAPCLAVILPLTDASRRSSRRRRAARRPPPHGWPTHRGTPARPPRPRRARPPTGRRGRRRRWRQAWWPTRRPTQLHRLAAHPEDSRLPGGRQYPTTAAATVSRAAEAARAPRALPAARGGRLAARSPLAPVLAGAAAASPPRPHPSTAPTPTRAGVAVARQCQAASMPGRRCVSRLAARRRGSYLGGHHRHRDSIAGGDNGGDDRRRRAGTRYAARWRPRWPADRRGGGRLDRRGGGQRTRPCRRHGGSLEWRGYEGGTKWRRREGAPVDDTAIATAWARAAATAAPLRSAPRCWIHHEPRFPPNRSYKNLHDPS